jgi:hypothetical protein
MALGIPVFDAEGGQGYAEVEMILPIDPDRP